MTTSNDRRPLASRDSGWAQTIARRLAATSLTPDRVSQLSMLAAAFAGGGYLLAGHSEGWPRGLWLVLAVLGCQGRLLCNLFDGMLAIESGKASAEGAFWNEVPDRVSDTLILVAVGYAIGEPALGWAATAMAILTAYVRAFGQSCGQAADFVGPMAKPHRMALLTGATLLSLLAPLWDGRDELLLAALWLIAIGSLVTAWRRGRRLRLAMAGGGQQ
jgi:phosphatidylglycerophosphate synthase